MNQCEFQDCYLLVENVGPIQIKKNDDSWKYDIYELEIKQDG